jgi:TadE-like protein
MSRLRARGERGQSAVELALFLPVLLAILYVVIEFGQVSTGLTVSVNSTWTPGSPVTVTSTYAASVTILAVTLYSGYLTTKRTVRALT